MLLANIVDAEPPDAWSPLRLLEGHWVGVGAGFGSESDVTHDWAFVIDGNFLELRTRSTVRTDTGGGEVHEDVAYVSHDRDHDAFVCRQFLSEGYVNTYDIRLPPDPGGEILFAHRDSEGSGGVRAQIRLRFVSRDEYVMALDLAFTPDAEFKACQEMRMHRRP